jgi:hypothetical protein
MFMRNWLPSLCLICVVGASQAGDGGVVVVPQLTHEQRWNLFVEKLYALHQKRLQGAKTREETRNGGYYRLPNFYREVSYYDGADGRLLSRIQWEREHPDRVHSIEVYVYDDRGRVARDYGALFLPHSRNAPMQTLINLHAYNHKLHAFRQFDASGNRIYEYCQGDFSGKPVELEVHEDLLIELEGVDGGIMATPVYRACFKGLGMTAGVYLDPQ